MSLLFFWVAVYQDGTTLPQIDISGRENLYKDIDRERLVRFDLVETTTGEPKVILHLQKGMRLIARRRTFIRNDGQRGVVWLVGWQETKNGINFQVVNFVFPDGHIETINHFVGDHILYGNVILTDDEMKE